MPRDREAGAAPPGATQPGLSGLPQPLLPLALLAVAVVAALLAGHEAVPGWLLALALLLATAGAAVSGAYWSRQRQLDKLREARLQHQLLGQMLDVWQWQTDAEHRLVRMQPPQGAPGSAWVEGAFSGERLWERFDDAEHSLAARMQAQAAIAELRVLQAPTPPDARARHWRLRGLPRFDSRGRFTGYLGVAEPAETGDAAQAARLALDDLLQHGPGALCWAVPQGEGWVLRGASPAARALLGLTAPADTALPWAQVLAGLPDGLRPKVAALAPGEQAEADGWQARLLRLGAPDGPTQGLLLVLAATDSDGATRALAAEHAAFSYTISHDLRAPIRVVEGFGRILKEDYGGALDRIGNDHLDRVTSAAARMNHMIDALLSLSQLSTQPLSRQPVNLSQLAGFVVDELKRAHPDRPINVQVAPGMSTQGDPTLLRMALENLLGNACKYSAKVTQPEVHFETVEQGGRLVYVVRDNGAGFDMRFVDRLFGVFQRLHSASDFPGNGVGLASVRRIVRRHGGEIWAESEVGRGARFYFTLKA